MMTVLTCEWCGDVIPIDQHRTIKEVSDGKMVTYTYCRECYHNMTDVETYLHDQQDEIFFDVPGLTGGM